MEIERSRVEYLYQVRICSQKNLRWKNRGIPPPASFSGTLSANRAGVDPFPRNRFSSKHDLNLNSSALKVLSAKRKDMHSGQMWKSFPSDRGGVSRGGVFFSPDKNKTKKKRSPRPKCRVGESRRPRVFHRSPFRWLKCNESRWSEWFPHQIMGWADFTWGHSAAE